MRYELGDNATLSSDRVIVCRSYTGWREGTIFVIGNEYGALCAVLGTNIQDALDTAADEDMLAGLALDDEEAARREDEDDGEGIMRLGNAGEPFDSIPVWVRRVEWADLDRETLADLIEIGICRA